MTTTKTIGAAAGSLILLSSAALAAAPAVMDITADAAPTSAVEQADEQAAAMTDVQRVEGQFSYDQGVTTSNEAIASVFAKAAAALCDPSGEPGGSIIARAIQVTCATGACFEATVADMADEEGADSYTIGCSCATNGPGGGAIANAEVSGVSLATLATLAA